MVATQARLHSSMLQGPAHQDGRGAPGGAGHGRLPHTDRPAAGPSSFHLSTITNMSAACLLWWHLMHRRAAMRARAAMPVSYICMLSRAHYSAPACACVRTPHPPQRLQAAQFFGCLACRCMHMCVGRPSVPVDDSSCVLPCSNPACWLSVGNVLHACGPSLESWLVNR